MGSPWTENAVHRLRELIAEGMSGDEAAAALAAHTARAFTRDMVTSKARALGLSLQGRAGRRAKSEATPETIDRRERADARAGRLDGAGRDYKARVCGFDLHPIPLPLEELRYIPPAQPMPFLYRPDSGCAWPAGDWLDRGTVHTEFCCGRIEPGRPYCREHSRIAYEGAGVAA